MSYDNRLELVVEIDGKKARGEVLGINRSLSDLERGASLTATRWATGMDRMSVDAARAMQRTSKEMQEARQAASLLAHHIGVQLPTAVQNFLAKSSLLGGVLTSLFRVSVWGAIGVAIYEAAKKLWDWARGAEEAAKQTKDLADEVKKLGDAYDKYAADLERAKRAGAIAGATGAARTGIELGFKKEDLAKAVDEYAAYAAKVSRLYLEARRGQMPGETPSEAEARRIKAGNEYGPAQDLMNEALARRKVLEEEVLTLQTQYNRELKEEARIAREKVEDARVEEIGYKRQMEMLISETDAWGVVLDAIAAKWKTIDYGIGDVVGENRKLMEEWRNTPGVPSPIRPDQSGITNYEDILKPSTAAKQFEQTVQKVGNQVSTVVTDWSAALARAALDVRNFGSIIISAARSTAEMLLRTVIERSLLRTASSGVMSAAAGGVGIMPGGGGGAGTAGAGGVAGTARGEVLGMLGANLKNFIGLGGAMPASLGGKLTAIGKSNAALLGGGMLIGYGLKRGGVSGMAMTTAGGALIGFKYGGALGAAIGAAAGFTAGFIRLFIKGAQEKAREKIRATYGVDIHDKKLLGQIVDIAKQGYGGNLDMAIRGPEIRDLVELYAMHTGQSTRGMPAKMTPLSLVHSGGTLHQLPGAGLGGSGGSGGAGPITINVSVPGARQFFEQETVQVVVKNPRAVQTASTQAMKSNSNRRESAALQLSPGTLTS